MPCFSQFFLCILFLFIFVFIKHFFFIWLEDRLFSLMILLFFLYSAIVEGLLTEYIRVR